MRLLLTSTGLANLSIRKLFLRLLNKPISKVKVIFVPTAARAENELKYVRKSKQQLLDLGILEKNIFEINLDTDYSLDEFMNCDLIYVCGGNTFYLLKKVRETGFDRIIVDFVKSNKLYFGVSAGSILACPDISIAAPFDVNDSRVADFSGLNLIDVVISPHYSDKDKQIIEKFRSKSDFPVVPLTDNQALLIIDGKKKIIE